MQDQRRYRSAVPTDHYSEKGKEIRGSHEYDVKKVIDSSGVDKDAGMDKITDKAPRNSVGVQLLSPSLHAQVFPPTTAKVPPVKSEALSLCQHHLQTHGLQPEQASSMAPIAFDLPPLQGKDLSQHFWTLGRQAAQPWLGMAHSMAATSVIEPIPEGVVSEEEVEVDLRPLGADEWLSLEPSVRNEEQPPIPRWLKKPGWVRYPIKYSEDGSARALGDGVSVSYPLPEDGALVFDVETMVQESPFAVMATAVGANAWYAWLSPWLLQQGERCNEKDHLIPFGPADAKLRAKQPARLLIGHNIGYDRARVQDEYSMERSNIRFLDTMSLHVATRGISSPQRGAWIKHSKGRALEKMLDQDNVEEVKKDVIRSILGGEDVDEEILAGLDLDEFVKELQKGDATSASNVSLDQLASASSNDSEISSSASLLWQDVTSKNSLVDVAKLHCNIELSKETRNVFVDGTSREEILSMLDLLLQYCATDVLVTQKVFRKVWPAFIHNCPNPATTAGVLGLGSAILPVDDEWVEYINRCDEKYELALNDVKANLVDLAEQLRVQGTDNVTWDQAMEAANARMEDLDSMSELSYGDKLAREEQERLRPKLWWEGERWASQLDWTPKKPKKNKSTSLDQEQKENVNMVPRWYRDKVLLSSSGLGPTMAITPCILRLHHNGQPIVRREDGKWVIKGQSDAQDIDLKGSPLRRVFLKKDEGLEVKSKLGQVGEAVLMAIRDGSSSDDVRQYLREAADALVQMAVGDPLMINRDTHLAMLDWTPSESIIPTLDESAEDVVALEEEGEDQTWWPKWYWDLYKSASGQLEVTIRSKIAPLLLCVTWQGCPLYHSRQHGWLFRYDPQDNTTITTRQPPVSFTLPADQAFRNEVDRTVSSRLAEAASKAHGKDGESIEPNSITPRYYKVPHVAGDGSNVGSPFSKGFLPLFEKGTMQSEHADEVGRTAARNALQMNAECSYWIGVRDRVRQQMVVWEGQGGCDAQFSKGASGARQDDEREKERRKGIILPPVIPMGTVTRRAIEKTWLTASNAKSNRVGSELKALVKSPPGWSIVGADVDSQELWICSVMGDAQFGVHGATAIGWMTLEGSKSLGTDLHSKTAGILGTSRNQAKVFNYSRIYGAGIRHSSQLLLKANPTMTSEEATRKAKELYANTKGTNTQRKDLFGRKFWYGGTESYVFNKLEEIALSEQPKTPALDCGVTAALSRKYLPKGTSGRQGEGDYMPSRINWVVQSSGVDYLHLLITSMEHLITTYQLKARFMISVHDEVRYLAKDEDAHRVALALQISNLWTRAMFAHKLEMDNLPQGVAFFAQVDIDKVLRKEADDPCITPSQPNPIPPGYAEDIQGTLELTNGGSLFADGRSMRQSGSGGKTSQDHLIPLGENIDISLPKYSPSFQSHRSVGDRGLRFLQAQASDNLAEISSLDQRVRMMEKQSDSREGKSTFYKTTSPAQNFGKRVSVTAKEKSKSPFGSTYSFHTHAGSSAMLPSSLTAILDKFPAKPLLLRVPFYKTKEHRQKILWAVYKPLLKQCPAEYSNLRQMIQRTIRAKRHCTSPRQTEELVQQALILLDKFQRHRMSDEEATKELEQEDRANFVKQHERGWKEAFDRYLQLVEEEKKPIPRPTGALLPPTIYNPPLLRYKPVQPEGITMMIRKRILSRDRRIERWHDNEEIQSILRSEVKMWSTLASSHKIRQTGWEDQSGWLRPPQEQHRAFKQTRDREDRRSKMIFSVSMLRYAKAVRARRQKWSVERKRERRNRSEHRLVEAQAQTTR